MVLLQLVTRYNCRAATSAEGAATGADGAATCAEEAATGAVLAVVGGTAGDCNRRTSLEYNVVDTQHHVLLNQNFSLSSYTIRLETRQRPASLIRH
jgi:hypothetical protein